MQTETYKNIKVEEVKDGVYELIFNRPRVLNAVNKALALEVIEVLDLLKEQGDARVLILNGEGRSFTVGADTTAAVEMSDKEYADFNNTFRKMLRKIEQFPSPVVAMIDGFAFGGGCEISLVCDIRFGSENASFRFPGASYGIVLSAGTLSTLVSLSKAKELLFSSAIIDAQEAYRIGILNQLVKKEELKNYVHEYADKVVKNSQTPVEKAKKVLNQLPGESKLDRKEIELQATGYLTQNTNQRDTFASFVEKRKKTRDW
ncbi:MAG TPA: enoyl-CoA hydratase/isomerase family protein [Candidatus Avamphibacillus sp.]|nr:enoyl-CoA hydratase/isomerase family protein [Candidatus Avamphibacillus sp.]